MQPIRALSFDCYGTLVDWEAGILAELHRTWPHSNLDDEVFLASFARHESRLESQQPILPYRQILGGAIQGISEDLGLALGPDDVAGFSSSVRRWPLYPEVRATLRLLGSSYQRVILSNVDRESFAATEEMLAGCIDAALIAEDIGAYKPAPEAFAALLQYFRERGIQAGEVLHVAQSHYHDQVPAARAGLRTCWLDRRAGKPGSGAVIGVGDSVQPDLTLLSLDELPGRLAEWSDDGR